MPISSDRTSPSRLAAVLECPRKARRDLEGHVSDVGPEVCAGGLVHRCLDALAKAGAQGVTGADLAAEIDDSRGRLSDEAVARALEVAASMPALDLSSCVASEVRATGFDLGDGVTATLVVDRVDEGWHCGARQVEIVDYKTGRDPLTSEQLEHHPQTVVYLAWAAREYFRAGEDPALSMVYLWPETGHRVVVHYDAAAVAAGLAAAARTWKAFCSDADPPATPEPKVCRRCDHRGECPELAGILQAQRSRPEWEELPLPELVALRHHAKGEAGLLEVLLDDIDEEIMTRLEADGSRRHQDEHHTAAISSRGSTRVAHPALAEVCRRTRLSLDEIVAAACSISAPKLRKVLDRIGDEAERDAARKALATYETTSQGKPFLLVRPRGGGLF